MNDKHSILIIGKVWPEPGSSAAGSRMMQLIRSFLDEDFLITFASTAARSDYSENLDHIGVKQQKIQLNDPSFDDFISELKPDYVLFDRFMTEEQFGWRVAEHHPGAMRILDTVDLHSLRSARHAAWKLSKPFDPAQLLTEEISKREIASILRCDLSLIISEAEMEILKEVFMLNCDLLFYMPFLLDEIPATQKKSVPSFKEREHFITIGNFLHEPNWNAVLWLKEELWPLIRKKLSNSELHIYGAYPSEKVFNLNNRREGFLVKGRTENALSVVEKSRVLLAPLRFGAGLKGKLIDAMLAGTPSVTTDIGAEGMAGAIDWGGSIENEPEGFANAAVELYQYDEKWYSAQENGFNILNQRFNKDQFVDPFIRRMQSVKGDLESHRMNNFLGSLLMQNTLASTKYMSKWIEEKNRK